MCFFSTISFSSNKNKDKFRILKMDDHNKLHFPHLSFSFKLEAINSFSWHFLILKCFIRTFIFIIMCVSAIFVLRERMTSFTRLRFFLSAAKFSIFLEFCSQASFLFYFPSEHASAIG